MKVIAGLGNPGFRYRNTKHNAGVMCVSAFARAHRIRIAKRLYNSIVGEANIGGTKVMLVLPETFMNLSGAAIKAVAYKVKALSDILVVYDDIDIPLGELKFKPKGSSGGHNGMKSIIESLGQDEFPRLRVGIKPEHEVHDRAEYVLKPFDRGQRKAFQDSVNKAAAGIDDWVLKGMDYVMTKYNC